MSQPTHTETRRHAPGRSGAAGRLPGWLGAHRIFDALLMVVFAWLFSGSEYAADLGKLWAEDLERLGLAGHFKSIAFLAAIYTSVLIPVPKPAGAHPTLHYLGNMAVAYASRLFVGVTLWVALGGAGLATGWAGDAPQNRPAVRAAALAGALFVLLLLKELYRRRLLARCEIAGCELNELPTWRSALCYIGAVYDFVGGLRIGFVVWPYQIARAWGRAVVWLAWTFWWGIWWPGLSGAILLMLRPLTTQRPVVDMDLADRTDYATWSTFIGVVHSFGLPAVCWFEYGAGADSRKLKRGPHYVAADGMPPNFEVPDSQATFVLRFVARHPVGRDSVSVDFPGVGDGPAT